MKQLQAWFIAARPKTWVAAILPVMAAWVLSLHVGVNHSLMFWALLAALFLQIATNFWNDYFDDIKGSDSDARQGPRRLLQLKIATRKQVSLAASLLSFLSFAAAIPIFLERGWGLALLGILSLFMAIAYTGGPFPLAYLGLGELFVLIFFGWVATYFSFFVGTGEWSFAAGVLGVQVGLLSCTLITINNLRDYAEDKKSKKNTLVVLGGERFGLCLLGVEFFVPYLLQLYWIDMPRTLLSFWALPLAVLILVRMARKQRPNQQLAFASLHALLFLLLWSLGVLLND